MRLIDILMPHIATQSLLIGYYGGGNYGDELLLEVLQNLCRKNGVENVTIAYQQPKNFKTYHHEFGYPRVDMRDKRAVFRAVRRSKQIIVGGGGLWGLDFNFNVFLLSCMLAFSKIFLRKKIYLIGVGYYSSTTKLGHFGAWLVGKTAESIYARDQETLENFRKTNPCTYLDTDIAWYLRDLNLRDYREDVHRLESRVSLSKKTLVIVLRRFQDKHRNNFTKEVEQFIKANPDKPIIVTLLEPQPVDPDQHALIQLWASKYPNVQALAEQINPLALFLFFNKHRKNIALVAPQFHAIITAHLNGVPFMPIVYDNKVAELLRYLGFDQTIPIRAFSQMHLQLFANDFYGGVA